MKQSQPTFIQIGRLKLNLTQALIPGIVLILVGVILGSKAYQTAAPRSKEMSADFTAMQPVTEKTTTVTPSIFLDAITNSPKKDTPVAEILPETQLDQYLAAGKPTVAFFHSNDCVQCIKMIEVVDQVYPNFADKVALLDVNVYEQRNANLLRRAGVRAIPTMIFIDRTGQGQGVLGFMEPDAFRRQLQQLATE